MLPSICPHMSVIGLDLLPMRDHVHIKASTEGAYVSFFGKAY